MPYELLTISTPSMSTNIIGQRHTLAPIRMKSKFSWWGNSQSVIESSDVKWAPSNMPNSSPSSIYFHYPVAPKHNTIFHFDRTLYQSHFRASASKYNYFLPLFLSTITSSPLLAPQCLSPM